MGTPVKRNLTLAIEEDLLHRARLVAAQRKRTLTGLVREFLEGIAHQDRARAAALRRLCRLMSAAPLEVGAAKWTRDELHER